MILNATVYKLFFGSIIWFYNGWRVFWRGDEEEGGGAALLATTALFVVGAAAHVGAKIVRAKRKHQE